MKLIVETGSESHSTSSASVTARYASGPYAGKHLYQVLGRQIKVDWLANDRHSRWVQTEYDLPEGTEIAIVGKGATGPRGAIQHQFHRMYRLESSADVVEERIDVGLRSCLLKGRLVLVQDLATKASAIDTNKGF